MILLDLMMPEMTGAEVYEQLKRLSPDHADRVILMTGGAFTAAAREFLDRVRSPRVDKPVEPTNLLALIDGIARR